MDLQGRLVHSLISSAISNPGARPVRASPRAVRAVLDVFPREAGRDTVPRGAPAPQPPRSRVPLLLYGPLEVSLAHRGQILVFEVEF